MARNTLLLCLVALLLLLPGAAFSFNDVAVPDYVGQPEPDTVTEGATMSQSPDERVQALEAEYAERVSALEERVVDQSRKAEQNRLQEEIMAVKAEEDLALLRLHHAMAVERGDEDGARLLREEIDRMENPPPHPQSSGQPKPFFDSGLPVKVNRPANRDDR